MVIATLMTVLIHGCVIASLIPLPVPGIFKRDHSKKSKKSKGTTNHLSGWKGASYHPRTEFDPAPRETAVR